MKLPRLRLRLLPRVALALAAVGLLPLAIAAFGLVDVNRDALFEQVLRTHGVAAETGATRTGAFLATRLSLARGAAASPALADPRSPEARDFLLASLSAWAELDVEAVAVVNEQGEEVIRAQLKGGEDRRRVEEALRLLSEGPVAAIPGDPPVIRLEVPLAEAPGSLRLVCDGASLAEVAHPVELGEQAEIVVAARNGKVVLGSPDALAGLPRPLVETALSGRLSGAGRFPDGKGGEILAGYAPVSGSDWTVLSRQPAVVAEAVAGKLRRRAAYAVGAALALIGLLSAAAYGSVIRPLRELVAEQRSLAQAAAPAPSGDEISDLRRTFDALRRSLVDRSALSDVFLGRYQVQEVLGTGGMGTVFRGWDPKLQRPVALKTVRLGGTLPPERRGEMIATLLREAVTVARFSHPHVVTVYDLEDSPEGAFVAMELVEGSSLERLLWQRDHLGPERVVPLGAAMARGLAAAHARGVIHRDVKPANVLLGKDGSIKVADFGISGLVAAAAEEKDIFFGTPGYVPPECLQGHGYGPAGDLFALGVLLYECLTGTRPFGGLDVSDAVQSTLFGIVHPPGKKVAGIPPELDSLILHLLERDPRKRASSAAAVAEELERMAAANGYRWSPDLEAPSAKIPEEERETIGAQWIRTTRL